MSSKLYDLQDTEPETCTLCGHRRSLTARLDRAIGAVFVWDYRSCHVVDELEAVPVEDFASTAPGLHDELRGSAGINAAAFLAGLDEITELFTDPDEARTIRMAAAAQAWKPRGQVAEKFVQVLTALSRSAGRSILSPVSANTTIRHPEQWSYLGGREPEHMPRCSTVVRAENIEQFAVHPRGEVDWFHHEAVIWHQDEAYHVAVLDRFRPQVNVSIGTFEDEAAAHEALEGHLNRMTTAAGQVLPALTEDYAGMGLDILIRDGDTMRRGQVVVSRAGR